MSPEAGAGLGSSEFLTTPIPAPSEASAVGGGAEPVRRVALPHAEATAEPDPRPAHPGRAHVPGPPDRFEADLGTVALVTDRGVAHARNEDAVAAGVGTPHPGARPLRWPLSATACRPRRIRRRLPAPPHAPASMPA